MDIAALLGRHAMEITSLLGRHAVAQPPQEGVETDSFDNGGPHFVFFFLIYDDVMDEFMQFIMESGKEENQTELDKYLKECLCPTIVQALICTQHWLRDAPQFDLASLVDEEQNKLDEITLST
ncbi:hypothetical protein CCACVL1_28250 [Corchorus capsularis]|uniref:Uncharacterized protein n=1 Tax=Corchorus capsularis TaxID=210143 RepID=A0A1R3G748_COCAP|nr:hypothetical protein CCACVL1_28250 [Corchorus capsularis]